MPATHIRTAGQDDYPALRMLAGAWFPAETLLDPDLYRRLLASRTVLARILTIDDRPAGYYAIWPLTAAAYTSLQRGDKRERDLDACDIVPPQNPRAAVLYLSDVCLAPGAPSVVLLRDLRRILVALLRAHPHIAHVAAWAFTPQGARLAGRLGMLPVSHNPALVQTTAASIISRLTAHPRGTTMTRYTIAWEEGPAAWTEAARFFARVISLDPAYISHGEIQTGLSLDGKTWIAELEARFLAEATGDPDGRSLAVARDAQGAVVAAAALSWSFETPDAPFATLQDLAVEPSLRSQGLGTEMVQFVEREVRARKALWLFLESGKKNHRAHTFFERAGFDEVSHVFAKRLAK